MTINIDTLVTTPTTLTQHLPVVMVDNNDPADTALKKGGDCEADQIGK